MIRMSFFYNIGIVSLLTMYMGLAPIDVETIPVLTLFFLVLTLVFSFYKKHGIDRLEMYVLFYMILIIGAGLWGFFINGYVSIIYAIKYLIGPVCFIASYREGKNVSVITLAFMVCAMLVYVLSAILFGESLVGGVLNIDGRYLESRFSILTKEPSYFVFYFFLVVVLLDLIGSRSCVIYSRAKWLFILKFCLLILAVLSGSAYVYGMVFIYLILFSYFTTKRIILYRIFISIILLTIFLGFLLFGEGTRFHHILNVLWGVLSGGFELNSIIYSQETSGSTRFILNYMALAIPFTVDIFGLGFGGFSENWTYLANESFIDIGEHEVLMRGLAFSPQTYFTSLVADIGILALLVIPIFSQGNISDSALDRHGLLAKYYIIVGVIIFMLFQCQISNPIPWIAIAYIKKGFYK
ncbi:hypothetical protein [Saccharospirillum impatiens]|uniref:hypothetical protein n=1 Tax=Saccharospirillum impatiens TaxID=169438 RepID=UPI00041471A7|nr:hypothetical protein [Saccharospirillum impatiens]